MEHSAPFYSELNVKTLVWTPNTIYAYVHEKGNWDIWDFFRTGDQVAKSEEKSTPSDSKITVTLLEKTTEFVDGNTLEEQFTPSKDMRKGILMIKEDQLFLDDIQIKSVLVFKDVDTYTTSYYSD